MGAVRLSMELAQDGDLNLLRRLDVHATAVRFEPDTSAAAAAALGRRYRDAGIAILQVGCPQNVGAADPRLRQGAAEALARALELAAAAGAEAVATGPGHRDPAQPHAPFAAHPDNFSEAALDDLAATCRRALSAVGRDGPRLLVETGVLSPLNTLLRASEAVRRVGHPAFGILLDPVNLTTLDNYFDNGSFLTRCVQQLGPGLGLVHAKDMLMQPHRFTFALEEVPIGRGALDYGALLTALAAADRALAVHVERQGDEAGFVAALGHLRAVAHRVGVVLV